MEVLGQSMFIRGRAGSENKIREELKCSISATAE